LNWNLLERARAGVNACSDFARECEQRQLRLIHLVRLCAFFFLIGKGRVHKRVCVERCDRCGFVRYSLWLSKNLEQHREQSGLPDGT
jgi:hypothetical protein